MEYRETNLPILKPDEVKIEIKACGICGSDIHGFLGKTGRKIPPMIMGHEFSGKIIEIGSNVKNYKIKDRVVVYPLIFCGDCQFCKNHLEELCINKKMFGVLDVNGAMADFINVPERLLFKLPENISYVDATLIEPLAVACSALNKINNLNNIKNSNLLVVGSGTIGLLLSQLLKDKEPLNLYISDVSNIRLEKAKDLGFFTINPNEVDIYSMLKKKTVEKGIDISFEAVGLSDTVQQAILTLHNRGTSVWIGNSQPKIEINMQYIVTKEIKIIGSYAYSLDDFRVAIEYLEKNKINTRIIISEIVKMEKGMLIFNELASGKEEVIKAVLIN